MNDVSSGMETGLPRYITSIHGYILYSDGHKGVNVLLREEGGEFKRYEKEFHDVRWWDDPVPLTPRDREIVAHCQQHEL